MGTSLPTFQRPVTAEQLSLRNFSQNKAAASAKEQKTSAGRRCSPPTPDGHRCARLCDTNESRPLVCLYDRPDTPLLENRMQYLKLVNHGEVKATPKLRTSTKRQIRRENTKSG